MVEFKAYLEVAQSSQRLYILLKIEKRIIIILSTTDITFYKITHQYKFDIMSVIMLNQNVMQTLIIVLDAMNIVGNIRVTNVGNSKAMTNFDFGKYLGLLHTHQS